MDVKVKQIRGAWCVVVPGAAKGTELVKATADSQDLAEAVAVLVEADVSTAELAAALGETEGGEGAKGNPAS